MLSGIMKANMMLHKMIAGVRDALGRYDHLSEGVFQLTLLTVFARLVDCFLVLWC